MGLADLNTYSEEQIEFTDNRPANVIFSSPVPEDQSLTTTEYSITVIRPYEIEEIIQPDVTLVRYSIDVSGVSGSTVTWDTIPTGSTVTVAGGVYTIDGIDDLDTWDIVKDPTININPSFTGSFFYNVSITYNTASGLQTYEWQVGTFIPQAFLTSNFTQNSVGVRVKGLFVDEMSSEFAFEANPSVTMEPVTFSAEFNKTTAPIITASARFNRSAVFGASINISVFDSLANAEVQRTYIANTGTQIFNQTPQPILTLLEDGSLYRIKITIGSGYLIGSTVEPQNQAGTKNIQSTSVTTLEELLKGLRYYPSNYNETSNIGYQLSLYRNNVLIKEYNISTLVNDGTDTTILTGVYDTVSSLENIWSPQFEDTLYANRMDFIVLGAGGGGANNAGGGGGGAGERIDFLAENFNGNVTFSLDNGGAGGAWGAGSFGEPNAGEQGETATWVYYNSSGSNTNIVVRGGFGGGDGSNGIGIQQGSNTPGSTFTGGSGFINQAGGGGAGAAGNGQNAVSSGGNQLAGPGGDGIEWDGFEYGRGGGGAENGISAYRLDDYGIGSGGHGASSFIPSHNQNGGPSGILIRMYRV